MRAGLSLITPPASEPLTLAQLKSFLRVEVADDDALITEIGVGARDFIEDRFGVAFMPQTWDQVADGFPLYSDALDLLRWPIQSISSIKYTDSSNQVQTWSSSNYIANLVTKPPRVAPAFAQFWPIVSLQPLANVTVRFVAGFANAGVVPQRMKHAVYLMAAHFYEQRSPVLVGTISKELELGLNEIMKSFRVPLFA